MERRAREIQRLSVECARTRVEATEQRERADDVTAQLSSLQSRAAATQRQLSEDGNLLAAEAAHLEDRLKLLETEREDALAARPPPPRV